ncbi:MAG TPA: FAD-dependent oxidoreductase [Beutenbergiaceae bacterium]|nr:FAD-dependent oxidoreductase [Beutenbergiaceae bacterium]
MNEADVQDVDLLVIGGGKAGKSLAMDRAKAGWSVVMVERDKIGGTCINVACIPTKSLIESARTVHTVREAAQFGVIAGGELQGARGLEPRVDLGLLRHHKNGVVDGMVQAHEQMFEDSGMDFVLGTAEFTAPRTASITTADGNTRSVRGRNVVINTGTTPAWPDLPGLEAAQVWDTEDILHLERIPDSLLILGGGYVGCEFASMFAAFGSRVTLLQGGEQLLAGEDPDVATHVAQALTDQGVRVRLSARVNTVRRDGGDGEVVATLEDGTEVRGSQLLLAAGRTPVTADLNLSATGVDLTDQGFVVVDDQLRTTAEGVWSVGDVAGSPQFTHASWHDFRLLRRNLTGGQATTSGRVIPYVVFMTPELARIGLTETQARERGHQVKVASLDAHAIPRAKTRHDEVGMWKAVIDAADDRILGVSLFGRGAGEVLAAVQMAMLGGLPYQQVRDAPITHPTMAEGLNLLLDTVED